MTTEKVEVYKDGKLDHTEEIEIPPEQVQLNARTEKINTLLAKTVRTTEETNQLVDLLAASQGFNLPAAKHQL